MPATCRPAWLRTGSLVLWAGLLGAGVGIPSARADKLLGIESPEDAAAAKEAPGKQADEEAAASDGEEGSAPMAAPGQSTKRAYSRGGAPEAGDFTFSGGLGASNKGIFGGSVTVGYAFNRYLGVDGTYSYFQVDKGDTKGVEYGPQVDVVARLPNPTLVTPYIGAGPGYVKWQRRLDGEVYDAGGVTTASMFGGANLNLTRHFGLQLERRQTAYLAEPPKRLDDVTSREPKSKVATNIGFYMRF